MTEDTGTPKPAINDNLDQYRTRAKREIVSNLLDLSRSIEPLTILFDSGKQSFPTTIIAVISDNTEVVIERASREELNQKLLTLNKGTVIGQPEGIRLRFLIEDIRADEYEGESVLITPIPKEHYRMQRRRYFRIDTLIRAPIKITIAPPDKPEFTLSVGNISTGGLRLDDPGQELTCKAGEILRGCTLKIPDVEPFSIDLRVSGSYTKKKSNGHVIHYAGCEFRELNRKQEHEIQKYINTVQLAERAVLQ
ncbi:MAG: flagellar brake protein [Halioglobus sp.]